MRDKRKKQFRIHDSLSHVRWAGALMEVGSLSGLNFAVKKETNRRTARQTDQPTDRPSYKVYIKAYLDQKKWVWQ